MTTPRPLKNFSFSRKNSVLNKENLSLESEA